MLKSKITQSTKISSESAREFNEDLIVRGDLPRDVFELIHDLAYDHEGRDRSNYMHRAQKILQTVSEVAPSDIDRAKADVEQKGHVLSVWAIRHGQASEAVMRANKLYWAAKRRLAELKGKQNDTEKP